MLWLWWSWCRDVAPTADMVTYAERGSQAAVHTLRLPSLHIDQTSNICHYLSWDLTQEGKLSQAWIPLRLQGTCLLGK